MEQESSPNNKPRSERSTLPVYLRFENCTSRCIEVVWINFGGSYERYQLLRNFSNFVDINTFESHPWLALDQRTKDPMWIDKQPIYFPKQQFTDLPDPENPNLRHPVRSVQRRQTRYITLPMHSLRQWCLLEIRNHLREGSDIEELNLPTRIVEDLRKLITNKIIVQDRR